MKKRLLSIILALTLCAALFAGCGSSSSSAPTAAPAPSTAPSGSAETPSAPAETTFGIEPFAEQQTLRVGYFAGSPLSIPWYIADREGFFEELNIKVQYETFTNGPAMMEANADWDVAGAGSAGVLVGQIGYDCPMIGVSDYEDNQGIFVRPDSPIAKDPTNPENWKGTTWLYASGTTAHLTLSKQLETLGLTTDDITSVNMDVSSALNAFKGGEGDGLAVWMAFSYMAEDEGFVRITDAGKLGITNSSGTVATRDAIANKTELVTKAWTVFYRTWEWCQENDENLQKAIDYYLENCEEEGVAITESIAERIIKHYNCPSFDRMVELMTKATPDEAGLYTSRDLLLAERDLLVPMDFFIAQGKYTPEDRVKLLDNNLVDNSIAVKAQELYAGK